MRLSIIQFSNMIIFKIYHNQGIITWQLKQRCHSTKLVSLLWASATSVLKFQINLKQCQRDQTL